MQTNTGTLDRILRLVVGGTLLAVAGFAQLSTMSIVIIGIVAAIAIATAFAGFCPLYRLVGISTCRIDDRRAKRPA